MRDSFSVYFTRVFGNDRYELSRFHSLMLLMRQLRRAEDLVQYPYTTCFIRFAYKKAMVNWPKGLRVFLLGWRELVRSQWRVLLFWRHARNDRPRDQLKANFETLKAG